MGKVWISPAVLHWNVTVQGWKHLPAEIWKRPYILWNHADRYIKAADTELMLVDGITTLRRVINLRVRHIFRNYELRTLKMRNRGGGTLELLEQLELIKPSVLKRLLEVRNVIEHEDRPPPDKTACAELSEFTWYFLRATDHAASAVTVAIGLTIPRDEDHFFVYDGWGLGIKLTTGPEEQWRVKMEAALPASVVSFVENPGWIEIEVSRTQTRSEWLADNSWFSSDDVAPLSLDDLFLEGSFVGPPSVRDEIYRLYFAAI